MADPELVPLPLETIRIAFFQLTDRVNTALRTQIGDRLCLQEQNGGVLRLLQSIQQHADVIPVAEHQIMEDSITQMLEALATASVQSEDPPPAGPGISVSRTTHTGQRGRPRIEIDYDFLAFGLELRGPTGLAPVAGVASRTIRCRALEYGLVDPADPVYVETRDENSGDLVRTYTFSTTAPVSSITDEDLDQLMHQILQIFPTFGQHMIDGHLRQLSHHVPTSRVRESWHIIIHAFINGYSRFVTGIRANNNNNRAATVLDLFLQDVLHHGVPQLASRVLISIRVCRSVHNIRIERLWCDVTRGFGRKWSNFFLALEFSAGLRPDLDAHIWLIHHLFLPAINQDAIDWVRTWNDISKTTQMALTSFGFQPCL
ncbi:hypothetical protein DFH07DRAFT_751592 [Mycena maculata]|uniref:Integrase core domain-containing protein n=1 Tax=Mycena maculata TaxID=230809 RepID=A0AAD7ID84_9AGAR|nr:hypothetical protein DFH07DRAFT_751592 [Mycena maculata]